MSSPTSKVITQDVQQMEKTLDKKIKSTKSDLGIQCKSLKTQLELEGIVIDCHVYTQLTKSTRGFM